MDFEGDIPKDDPGLDGPGDLLNESAGLDLSRVKHVGQLQNVLAGNHVDYVRDGKRLVVLSKY